MTVATLLASRQTTSAWYVLEVYGLPQRFHADTAAPTAAPPFVDWPGLLAVGPTSERSDPLGGIAAEEPVTVTIAATAAARSALLRIGPRGSPYQARLRTTLPVQVGAPDPITTDRDLVAAGWPAAGTVWVGTEAIDYAAIGGVGNVEFQGITRGTYGSRIARHAYVAGEWEADITGHCVNLDGLFARVRACHLLPDGTLDESGLVDVVHGQLQGPPQKSADGLTISLVVLPLTHSIRGKVGGDALVQHLVPGYHMFEESAHTRIPVTLGWREGEGYRGIISAAAAPGAVAVYASGAGPLGAAGGEDSHADVFDITLPADPVTGLPHPRSGQIRLPNGNQTQVPAAYLAIPPGPAFTVLPLGFAIGIAVADDVRNTSQAETHTFDVLASFGVAQQVVRWPRDVLVDFATWGNIATNKGAAGRWARLSLHERVQRFAGGPALQVRPNSNKHPGRLSVILHANRLQHLWYGIDWAPPGTTGLGWIFYPRGAGRVEGQDNAQGFHRGPDNDPDWMMVTKRPGDGDQAHDIIPLRRIASAFWATGERYVLVDGNFGGRTPPFDVRVTFAADAPFSYSVGAGKPVTTWHRVIAVAARNDPWTGNPVGYSLELDVDGPANRFEARPYGDWPGYDRAELQLSIRFSYARISEVLLKLLLSGEGNTFNSVWDVLPFGLDLDTSHVDVDSFRAFALPSYANEVDLDFRDNVDLRKLVEGLLKASGAQIVTRLNRATGQRKLTLVRTGLATSLESLESFSDADARDRHFHAAVDGQVINGADVAVNWDPDDERFGLDLELRDEPSYQALGRRWEILSLKMRGIVLDATDPTRAAGRFGPWFREVLAQYGSPTRVATLPVDASRALLLSVGDVVSVTSSHIEDERGDYITGGAVMRITSREIDIGAKTGQLAGRLHFNNGTGWAPACVHSGAAPSATELDTLATIYGDAIHPITGATMRDSEYLREILLATGGTLAVYYIPEGGLGYAGRTGHTITSIQGLADPNPGRITFAAPHGIVGTLGHIEPQLYDTQPAPMRLYAFQADAADTLGAAADPAREWV